jgi:hypothetical protein
MLEQSSRLHHQLIKFASQYSQWADVRHLGVMCWMIGEGSVNLTKWIDRIQTKAQIAQSTQKRLSRWVNNSRINPAKLYSPVVKAVKDDKSSGFNLENSKLRSAPALSRLCLVMAMTTLFLTDTGVEVVVSG